MPAVRPADRRTVASVADTAVVTEHRGRVMGTDLHVVATGTAEAGAGAVVRTVARLMLLEARWSRFRPTSEFSRAAAAGGTWVDVSRDTVRLVEAGLEAWGRTEGRCDPTGGAAIVAAGYDRDLAARCTAGAAQRRPAVPFPGPEAIGLDARASRLRLAPGTVLDAGAIGKGLAADLVVEELLDPIRGVPGLEGLLVNVGGDLRATGRAPVPLIPPSTDSCGERCASPWGIEVPLHPTDRTVRWSFTHGAVATSSSTKRVWDTTAGPAHHVLDPRTGSPAVAPPALVSVHAGAAWWAEAAATALMLLDPADRVRWVDGAGIAAVVVEQDGTVLQFGDVEGRLA